MSAGERSVNSPSLKVCSQILSAYDFGICYDAMNLQYWERSTRRSGNMRTLFRLNISRAALLP